MLADQPTIGNLTATLAVRLKEAPPNIDTTRLDALLPEYVLLPRWGLRSAQHTRVLEGHTNWVNAVAFSPDGHTLATASDDRTVRLWDSATGDPIRTLEGHTGAVRAVAFSPDGHTLATASDDRTVRLWDGQTAILRLGLEV